MNVTYFLNTASREEILDRLAALAVSNDPGSFDELRAFLLERDRNTYDKHVIPRLACRALILKGPADIRTLENTIVDAPGSIYPTSIIEALWHAVRGELAPGIMMWPIPEQSVLTEAPSPEAVREAKRSIQDIVLQSRLDEDLFDPLTQFLYQHNLSTHFSGPKEADTFRSAVFGILAESSIKISRRFIEELQVLIGEERREEDYQQFLSAHPVLIDPLASEVLREQRLGIERATDFVVRRLDNEYILVEIERPNSRIFTRHFQYLS